MLQLEDFALHDQLNLLRNKDNNMPVPIIAAAAAVAARLATKKLAQGAAKKVLPNTIRVSAADRKRIAARKAAANPKKASRPATKISNEPVSKNNTGKLMEPKSAVNVKPAAKPVGNPPNLARAEGRQIDSVARGEGVKGPLGKARDRRVFTSKNQTGSGKASRPVESKLKKQSNFIEMPVKDSKLGAKPGVFSPRSVAARKPTRKPVPNPKNPPKGTMVINSGSNRPTMLRKKAVPMKTPVVKKTPRKFAPPKNK